MTPSEPAPSRMTRVSRRVAVPRAVVYAALLEPAAVAAWTVPDGMSGHVHEYDARENGRFRITLTYEAPGETGKTTARSDTYHGRFVRLVPDELVVQVLEFETDDSSMQGEMTITLRLSDAPGGGTDLVAEHGRLPPGLPVADNELGWRLSLEKLARLLSSP